MTAKECTFPMEPDYSVRWLVYDEHCFPIHKSTCAFFSVNKARGDVEALARQNGWEVRTK